MDRIADAVLAVIGGAGEGPDRLLFWTESAPPSKFVRSHVSDRDRRELATALRGGRTVDAYLGHANCRICGAELGYRDLESHGMVRPDGAEHYVLEHGVWTPGCDELLRRMRGGNGG